MAYIRFIFRMNCETWTWLFSQGKKRLQGDDPQQLKTGTTVAADAGRGAIREDPRRRAAEPDRHDYGSYFQRGLQISHRRGHGLRRGYAVARRGHYGRHAVGKPCSAGRFLPVGGSGNRYPIAAGTRGVFAYVPQGNSVFPGAIAENLRLVSPDATDGELEQALKIACAWDFVSQFPDGVNHRLGTGGRGISEGQAQRLAIARALLRKAPILLLDEATSGLDMATERRLLDNLRQSGLLRTCILVTHRPDQVLALVTAVRRKEKAFAAGQLLVGFL